MYNYFGDLMQTLKNTIESEIEIKKSRFISIIKNIQSIEEFNTCIEELKVKSPTVVKINGEEISEYYEDKEIINNLK